jgi:hypothetical protein
MPATVTTLPSSASLDDVVATIERDGGVIIEDFLTPQQLAEVREDLLPKIAAQPAGSDDFSGFQTRRMSALFAKSRHMDTIATHPLFLGAAKHFVDVEIVYGSGDRITTRRPGLRIGVSQLIQIGPGEGAQVLHRDDWSFMWQRSMGREARLQIMVAISDFTAENGGTLVVPGSHTWGDDRLPVHSDGVPTEMRAGSALIWPGSTFHGGGTNTTTDQYRTGLTMAIDAANVRQEENMYLTLSPDVVRSYSVEVQKLLGWDSPAGAYMGWVEIDGRFASPLELL